MADPHHHHHSKAAIEEETEEEHAVRLRKISDEIKADMKAGRYRNGQLRTEISAKQPKTVAFIDSNPSDYGSWQSYLMELLTTRTISGRYTRETPPFHELYGGRRADYVFMDEAHDIKESMWITDDHFKRGQEKDGPKKLYWTQPIPEKGDETPPSDAKRAELRKKRKKRK